jgi:putative sigma-54 modulation protein
VKTSLTARNLELNDRIRTEIERKLTRLDRKLHPLSEAHVELIAHASHAAESANVAEITLVSNGHVMRSTAAGASPIAAFDVVLDKLERQIVRTKEKPRSVRERHGDEVESVLHREALGTIDQPTAPTEADGQPSVVKIKRFDMLPMFEEDAITQMEELGHAFFVFLNAETDAVAVLYRRRDGSYGLIEPVIGNGRPR